jgi:hypothetical protein
VHVEIARATLPESAVKAVVGVKAAWEMRRLLEND